MEEKNKNTLFIGDDEEENAQNGNDQTEDMYEAIFNEIKENFKEIDGKDKIKEEEELAKKQSEEEKEKEESSDNKDSAGLGDFVVVDKDGEIIKDKNKDKDKDKDGKNSDEDDF